MSSFDVLQVGYLRYAVSCADNTLYYAKTSLDTLKLGSKSRKVEEFGLNSSAWTAVTNNLGKKLVSTIKCCPSKCCPSANAVGYRIVIGTAENTATGISSTYYFVDPSPEKKDSPWQAYFLPESAKDVLALEPAATYYSSITEGVFALYMQSDGTHKLTLSGSTVAGKQTEDFIVSTSALGVVRDIFASVNPWRRTDLFIAGKGIGFIEASGPEQEPQIILPGIEFARVVASEQGTAAKETKISVLGLSTTNELYFIEGRRTLDENNESTITFPTASGIPIRTGVTQISPMFNKLIGANEVLYISNENDNVLHHLIRDPVTSMWNETTVWVALVKSEMSSSSKETGNQGVQYPAYVTRLTFANKDGTAVGNKYPVRVSCEAPVHVTTNGCSYNLYPKPQEVFTDATGQVEIFMRVHGLLGCLQYIISLKKFCSEDEKAMTYMVQPAQLVVHKLGQMKTTEDFKSAKQTDGKSVFGGSSASNEDFESMAGMLKQFPDMMKSVSRGTESDTGDPAEHVDYVIDENGKLQKYHPKQAEPSGFEKAVEFIGGAIGDAIEVIEKGFKTILRVVIRIAGPVINFYLKLQGMVISFVIKSAVTLLRTVAGLLKKTFGLDLSKLCGFLGFLFDIESIKSIQEELKTTMSGIIGLAKSAIPAVGASVEKNISKAQEKIRDFLGMKLDQKKLDSPTLPSWLRYLFDNPVVRAVLEFNPLAWIVEVIGEETEDLGISLPVAELAAMFSKFEQALFEWASRAAEGVLSILTNIVANVARLIGNPQQALEALKDMLKDLLQVIFNSLKDVVHLMVDTLLAFTEGIEGFTNGKWKIPLITAAWEALADQELTIMNYVTFLIANTVNLVASPFGGSDKVIKMLKSFQEKLNISISPEDLEKNISTALGTAETESPSFKPQHISARAKMASFASHKQSVSSTEPSLSEKSFFSPENLFGDQPPEKSGSTKDDGEKTKESNTQMYRLFLILATVCRSAHTFFTAWLADAPEGGDRGGNDRELMWPLAPRQDDLPVVKPGGNNANMLRFRDSLLTATAGFTTMFEILALFCYMAIGGLVASEGAATAMSGLITGFGWLVAATSARRDSTASRGNQVAAYIFRVEQIVAGLIRLLAPPILHEPIDWRMEAIGAINAVIQGPVGIAILADRELESRLILCIIDGICVIAVGTLNWMAS